MTRVVTTVDVAAPVADVWEELSNLAAHTEWMADAASIEFLGEQRQGPGTRIMVRTALGPLRTVDVMEFTIWEAPHRLAVVHLGKVRGAGEFVLTATEPGSSVTWRESLRFPWFLGGPLTGLVARPILRRVLARNLARLRDRIEGR